MELQALIDPLDAIFAPKSVAVIGASATPGKVGNAIVANLLASGFAGPVYPVNPSRDEILGLKVYKDVRDCPSPVDLAVVTVPLALVNGAVAASVAASVPASPASSKARPMASCCDQS